MDVLLINGSPRKAGCTYTILMEVAGELEKQEIRTEMFHIGKDPIRGCVDCGGCNKTGYCVFKDDPVNECIDLIKKSDAIVVGSPVYYAGPNGILCALLDRVFYAGGSSFANKPAAAVVNCRRGGASSAFDRLNKYFTISGMPVVSSQYWNATHGLTVEQVKQDLEGMQIMRTLGRNMAWLLKNTEAGRDIALPEREPWQPTNFIR